MSGKIRVLLADDHPIMTEGLKLTISKWEEFEIVGIASDGKEAVELSRQQAPDLLVMDMQMPKLSGPEAVRQIKAFLPEVRVLALTTFDDVNTVSEALEAGCNGFLLKVIEPEKLRSTMRSIADGLNVYDEDALSHLQKSLKERKESAFSPREREVLGYVCKGMTNADIASTLNLRPGTVKNMVSRLLRKSDCISRAQLVKYAAENRLIN